MIANSPVSRADITKEIGLTRMAISNIVAELIDDGYIKEDKTEENLQVGRNPIILDISNDSPLAVGVYIGRKSIYAVLTDIRLTSLYMDEIVFEKENENTLMQKLYEILDKLFDFYKNNIKDRDILGIGVSSIGPFEPTSGVLLNPREFFGITNFNVKEIIKNRYSLPVYCANDMNGAALAEKLKGKGRECGSFLYLGITNGIGAGIIVNNRLYGKESMSVGEIGHMCIDYEGPLCSCGNRGCLETYATIPNIIKKLKEVYKDDNIECNNFQMLSELPPCNAVFEDVTNKLSVALINAVNFLDPECIVIGHEGAYLPKKYLSMMQNEIEKGILSAGYKKVPVVHSVFSTKAPIFGSAAIILNRLFLGEVI